MIVPCFLLLGLDSLTYMSPVLATTRWRERPIFSAIIVDLNPFGRMILPGLLSSFVESVAKTCNERLLNNIQEMRMKFFFIRFILQELKIPKLCVKLFTAFTNSLFHFAFMFIHQLYYIVLHK